jgi:hypothetical protein
MKEWVPYVTIPLPEGAVDDGLGVDFYDTEAAKARGLSRQTAYPVATQRRNAITKQFAEGVNLAKKYHEAGDPQAGRDAAIYLASVAWKLPVEDSKQAMYMHDISPTFENEDTPFRRRSRAMFYNLRGQWPELSKSYDYLFPLLKDNAEIARAVGQFLPWIKSPQDLQQFFDSTLLQYRAHQIMTYNAWLGDPTPAWMAEVAATRVRLGIPVVGELHRGRFIAGRGEEHVGVAAFLIRTAANLTQAEHLEEGDGVLQRSDADHGVQIFGHGVSSGQDGILVTAQQTP